jgi:hypothetical protein
MRRERMLRHSRRACHSPVTTWAAVVALLVALVCAWPAARQVGLDGWALKPTPPREIGQLYWDLHKTTEAWTRIELRRPTGVVAPVGLIVQATWPGTRRTAPPRVIRLLAQAAPHAVLFSPSFALTLADEQGRPRALDLTQRPFESQLLFPSGCSECGFNAVDSRIPPSVLIEFALASRINGTVLGMDVDLQPGDIDALHAFAVYVGLLTAPAPPRRVVPPTTAPRPRA